MIIPGRCWTCNACVSHIYNKYLEEIQTKPFSIVCRDLGVTRPCCKRMLLTNVANLSETISSYAHNTQSDTESIYITKRSNTRELSLP